MGEEIPDVSAHSPRWLVIFRDFGAVAAPLATLALGYFTFQSQRQVDELQRRADEQHAVLQEEISARSQDMERERDRVETYRFVATLGPQMTGGTESERSFTRAVITAVLREEAPALFGAMQGSKDPAISEAGAAGLNEGGVEMIVGRLNHASRTVRAVAVADLLHGYLDSPLTVDALLAQLGAEQLGELTPQGIVNCLYILRRTSPAAWDQGDVASAQEAMAGVRGRDPGKDTLNELAELRKLLDTIATTPTR